MKRISSSMSGPSRLALTASLFWIPLSMGVSAPAQSSEQMSEPVAPIAAAPVVPQQVRYAGNLVSRAGDTVEAVFSIYAAAEDGDPLWTETQKVSVDAEGAYTVLLGSATQSGLPQTLFAAGQARWLGVAVERAPELPRVLLSSVPYAMKAGDAQALSGHPAGDFVTQEQLSQFAQTEAQRTASAEFQPLATGTITGSGTTGTIPRFTGTNTIGNSLITQVGSYIGISEATPVATLDVDGTAQFRGTLTIPAHGTATTTTSQPSQILQFNSSAWSTATNGVVTPTFYLYNGVLGNNTANPSGEIQLGYQLGTSHIDVLSITGTGPLYSYGGLNAQTTTLATTSAASNSPPVQLGAYAYSSKTSGQVSENFAWQVIPTGNDTTTPSANLNLLYGTGSTSPTGLSISSKGIINWATGQTFPVTGTGGGTITGITTTSPLTGSGTSGSVALGFNTSALETTLNSVYARLGATDTFSQIVNFNDAADAYQSTGPGYASFLGWGSKGSIGTFGDSDTGAGLMGETISGQGVVGYVTSPAASSTSSISNPGLSGVLGYTGTSFSADYAAETQIAYAGIWADTSGGGTTGLPVALFATADNAYGIASVTNSSTYPGLFVSNAGVEGAEISSGTGNGVTASTGSAGNGVSGTVSAPSQKTAGVLGTAGHNSGVYGNYDVFAGVWGDTGLSLASTAPAWPIGVLGTADDSYAGVFMNNSNNETTLFVKNYGTGGIGTAAVGRSVNGDGLFNTIMASSNEGTCGIGSGNLSCTGQIKSLVPTGGGSRTVETYAVQSPENWMEDFGSGELHNGVAVVQIDPAYGETISSDANYHVFLTPNGDSKSLYVINKTATTFEVRESGGGTSTLTFDYRIVAKRRGFETLRLKDVTERFTAETTRARLLTSTNLHKAAVRKPSPLVAALGAKRRLVAPPRAPVNRRVPTALLAAPAK